MSREAVTKRFLAMALCLCMIFSTVSGAFAYAEGPADEEESAALSISDADESANTEAGQEETSPQNPETPGSDGAASENGTESAQETEAGNDAVIADTDSGAEGITPYAGESPSIDKYKFLQITVYAKEAGTGEDNGPDRYTMSEPSFSIGDAEGDIWFVNKRGNYSEIYFYPAELLTKALEKEPEATTVTIESSVTLQQTETDEGYRVHAPIKIDVRVEFTKQTNGTWAAKYTPMFDGTEITHHSGYNSEIATVYIDNEFISDYRPSVPAIESMVMVDNEKPGQAFTFELFKDVSANSKYTLNYDTLVGTYTSDPKTGYFSININDELWAVAQSDAFPAGRASYGYAHFFLREKADEQSGLHMDPTVYIITVRIDRSPAGHVSTVYNGINKCFPGQGDTYIAWQQDSRLDLSFNNTTENVLGSVALHAAKLENGLDAVNSYSFNAYVWFEGGTTGYRLAAPVMPMSLDGYLSLLKGKLDGKDVYPVGTLTNNGRDITLSYEFALERVGNNLENNAGTAHFILFEDTRNANADPSVYQIDVPLVYDEYTKSIIAGESIYYSLYTDLDAYPASESGTYRYDAQNRVPTFNNHTLKGRFEGVKLENGQVAKNSYPFVMYKAVDGRLPAEENTVSLGLADDWKQSVEKLIGDFPFEPVGDVVWSEPGTGRIGFPEYEITTEDFKDPAGGGYYETADICYAVFELPTDDPSVAEDPTVYQVVLSAARDPQSGEITVTGTVIQYMNRITDTLASVYPEQGGQIVFDNRLNQNSLTLQGTKTVNGAVPEEDFRFLVYAAVIPHIPAPPPPALRIQDEAIPVSLEGDLYAWLQETVAGRGTVEFVGEVANDGKDILFPPFELKPDHFKNPNYPASGSEYYPIAEVSFFLLEKDWADGEHEGIVKDPGIYLVSVQAYYDRVTGKCWMDMESIRYVKFSDLDALMSGKSSGNQENYAPETGNVPGFVNGTTGITITGEKYENSRPAKGSYDFELYYAASEPNLPPPKVPKTVPNDADEAQRPDLSYDDLGDDTVAFPGIDLPAFRYLATVRNEGKDFVFPEYTFTAKDFEAVYPNFDPTGRYPLTVYFAVSERYVSFEESGMYYDRTIFVVPVGVVYDNGEITTSYRPENVMSYVYSPYSNQWIRDESAQPSSGGSNVIFNNVDRNIQLKAYKTVDGEIPEDNEKFDFSFDWIHGIGGYAISVRLPSPDKAISMPMTLEEPVAVVQTEDGSIRQNNKGDIDFEDVPRGDWNRVRYDFYFIRELGAGEGTKGNYIPDDTVYLAAVYWSLVFTNGVSLYVPQAWYYRVTGNPDYVLMQLRSVEDPAFTNSGYVFDETGVWLDLVRSKLVEGLEYVTPENVVFNNISLNDLTISKTVEGNIGDREKDFTFTVTFTDADGGELTESFAYTGDKEGKIASGESIKLKHGQSVTIHDIPGNTGYKVEESDNEGYVVTAAGNIGVIDRRATATAKFLNTANEDPTTPPVTPTPTPTTPPTPPTTTPPVTPTPTPTTPPVTPTPTPTTPPVTPTTPPTTPPVTPTPTTPPVTPTPSPSPSPAPGHPQTGDESNLGLWGTLMAVAVIGIVAVAVPVLKKKKK